MGNSSKIEIILAAVDRGLTAGFNRAMASVRGFATNAREAETGVRGLTTSVSGLLGPLLATVSVTAGMQKLVSVSREFDKISAGLVTATGSAEGADKAFAAIQDFAAKTPYDLAQVAEGFVKLVNFGLDPSEKALTSYGNTSSALGKDLNQMIEAVADAATGEFERLKEFGIKASSEGDKVSFTFRGVTTTVGKNAAEIEQYLIKLGETNFGDAMSNRMKTLDGALSNLGDEWNKVFLNISKAGIGNIIADSVRVGIDKLEELNAMISSGELEGYLRSIAGQFSGWADDVKASIEIVKRWYHDNLEDIKYDGRDAVTFLIDAFRSFPENVRAFIGLMVVQVAAGLDKVSAYAKAFKNGIAAIFNGQTFAGVGVQLENELKIINEARDGSIASILDERDASIKAAADKRTAAQLERIAWEEKEAARKKTSAEVLGQSRVQTDASQASSKSAKEEAKAKKEAEKATKKLAADIKKQYEEEKKIVAERLRFASQEKILAMELKRLEAGKLPTALARAEAEMAIDRRVMAERISLKQQELAALKSAEKVDQNDVIAKEAELAELAIEKVKQEYANLAAVARESLAETEQAWRRGTGSVEEYRAAVQAAGQQGVLTADEVSERMILAGDNMGAAFGLGFQRARESMQTDAEMMAYIGENLGETLAGGLSSAWDSFVTGTASAKEAMLDFARSTISWLSQIILKQLLLNAIQSAGSMFGGVAMAAGGAVQALAGGGSVAGWSPSPTADNIPAWLTAREFVQPVRAVDYYGLDFMERIRRLQFPKNIAHALAGGTLPRIPSGYRLAQGGMVPGQAPATTVKTGDVKVGIVNIHDESMLKNFMNTSNFDTILINRMRRNGSTINAILGR